jgi:lysophospholipase L1-like esterase
MLFQDGEKIVFTGDSVTDADRTRPVAEGHGATLGNGYVQTVDNLLNALCPDVRLHVCNTGISGNTSRDLLARYGQDTLAIDPDWIVCMIGINDVWRQFDRPTMIRTHVSLAEYSQNVASIIDQTLTAGKKLIMMTPYYMESNRADPMRIRTEEYASALKRICEAKGVLCLDTQAEFDAYLKHRNPNFLSWDRVHPGPVGSVLLARVLLRGIGFDRPLL